MFAHQTALILVHVESARPVGVLLRQRRFPSRRIVVRRTVIVDGGGCGVVLLVAAIEQDVHLLGCFRIRRSLYAAVIVGVVCN